MKNFHHRIVFIIMVCFVSGCTAVGSYQSLKMYDSPMLSDVSYATISYEGVERNPVIVIPGVLGSRLVNAKTGDIVWGKYAGVDVFRRHFEKKQLALGLPMEKGKELWELQDDLVSDGALDTIAVRLMGITFQKGAYNDMLRALQIGGYYEETFENIYNKNYYTCFQFGYDWRRDLAENARRLHAFILSKRAYLQRKYEMLYNIKDYNVQFDIVAHSMGGLLSRYYLRYGPEDLPKDGSVPKVTWAGSEHIDKIMIVGTPNAGYVDTITEMVHGLKLDPALPVYPPALVGTFHTLYQMLPVGGGHKIVDIDDPDGEALDVFDPDLWIEMEWGLADPTQDAMLAKMLPHLKTKEERREVALDHLEKCLNRARQFTQAMQVESTPPDDVALHLFLGDAVATSKIAVVDKLTGTIETTTYGAGDGKVLVDSAIFDTRAGGEWVPYQQSPINWSSVTFLFGAHMGITKDNVFNVNMIYRLLETETKEQRRLRLGAEDHG